jgi:hypothetical protein
MELTLLMKIILFVTLLEFNFVFPNWFVICSGPVSIVLNFQCLVLEY